MIKSETMPKAKSPRTYCGEDIARPLVVWLNKKGRRSNSPEWKIIRLIERLQGLIVAHKRRDDPLFPRFFHSEELASVNEELRRYAFRPSLTLQGENKIGSIRKWRFVYYEFLYSALCLAEQGHLLRLRRCNQCQRWLFARFSTQSVCSKNCRQKKYRASPTVKRRRRDYMRDYMRERYRKPASTRRVLPAKREKG